MAKNKPLVLGSMITVQDIQGWYDDNPLPPSTAELAFPLIQSDQKTWKSLSNRTQMLNEAADPISLNSTVPVAGRDGYKDIIGEMASFGKGREMDADDIEKFDELKRKMASLSNPAIAQQLINFYGDDLSYVRSAMLAEMAYLDWALVSNACNIGFVTANSPYMTGMVAMDYSVDSWQKDEVSTSWANAAAEILDDIEGILDTGEDYGKFYTLITVNKTWFGHIRKNTQIQTQCTSLAQSLIGAEVYPNLATINAMLSEYFNGQVQIRVVDEKVTRVDLNGTKTTANPFADGVAVFSQIPQLGHFEWNQVPIVDASRETRESFFLVGNILKIDPSYSKIYAKGRGFPVVDTYADNFYLRINAVEWS
jgi:hypothetical protein